MAMSTAQRQARFRERWLKDVNGTGSRLSLVIDFNAHLALKRLALRYGVTVTALVERLAMEEQRRLTDTLSADEHTAYCDRLRASGKFRTARVSNGKKGGSSEQA